MEFEKSPTAGNLLLLEMNPGELEIPYGWSLIRTSKYPEVSWYYRIATSTESREVPDTVKFAIEVNSDEHVINATYDMDVAFAYKLLDLEKIFKRS